jgi:hypothetical protein
MDWPDLGRRCIGESVVLNMCHGALRSQRRNSFRRIRTHISNTKLEIRADNADGVSRLMQSFQPNRTGNLVRLISLPDILRPIDELEILRIRLDHPDREVNLFERITAHVVVIRQFEVFGSAKMWDADGPEL